MRGNSSPQMRRGLEEVIDEKNGAADAKYFKSVHGKTRKEEKVDRKGFIEEGSERRNWRYYEIAWGHAVALEQPELVAKVLPAL
jgi:hypothetical protein